MTTRFPDDGVNEATPEHPLRRRSSTSPTRRRPASGPAAALPTWEPRDASVHAQRSAEPNGHAAARLRTYSSNRHAAPQQQQQQQQERRARYAQQQQQGDVQEGSEYSSHEAGFDPDSTLVASPTTQHFPQQQQRRDAPHGMHPLTIEHEAVGSSFDEDRLSPLLARPSRRRFDSLSSVGSSVAPGALPALPGSASGATGGGGATRRARGSSAKREASAGGAPASGGTGGATGGLESWLRSQAIPTSAGAGPPTTSSTHSHSQTQGGAPAGRVVRRREAGAGSDAGSDAGRSASGWSTGPRQGQGSGALRQREAARRLPDWDEGALEAEAEERKASRRATNTSFSAGGVVRREKPRSSNTGGITPSGSGLLASSSRNVSGVGATAAVAGSDAQLTPAKSVASSRTTFAPLPSTSLGRTGRTALGSAATSGAAKGRATASPLRRWVRWMAREGEGVGGGAGENATWIVGMLVVLVIKWSVALGGWSGRDTPPMWGDFEAQRHWMEITLHLPVKQWYAYDTQYWGLDYPPLTAYVSWLCGYIGTLIPGLAPSFALFTSRGSESANLVVYLRATVLVLDALIYTPAILFFLSRRLHGRGRRTRSMAALTLLAQPALILVDHGHFQYNGVMLGLAAASFALLYTSLPNPDLPDPESRPAALSVRSGTAGESADATPREKAQRQTKTTHLSRRVSYDYVAAALFFSLSLCFKQMALFYAPAVFAVMLGRCWGLANVGFERGLICFSGIGAVTLLTFLAMFAPWLGEPASLVQVIHRIFPVARGIFEDKVANVWCFLSVLPLPAAYKLKNALEPAALARLSLVTTLAAVLVPCAHLFVAAQETVKLEMFLDEGRVEESSRRRKEATPSVAASVRSGRSGRKARQQASDGSVVGRGANAGATPQQLKSSTRTRTRSIAASDAGSEMVSLLNARTGLSLAGGVPGSNASVLGGRAESLYASSTSGFSALSAGTGKAVASHTPSPAASVLPYALLSCSLAFFLFGFQTHEKSILIPLLPLCLLMTVKGDEWGGGAGKTDWEWAVLGNNVAVFSMWPLLKRDELGLQYFVLTLLWNWMIGFSPFAQLRNERKSFIGWTSAAVHLVILALHALELLLPTLLPSLTARILTRYPDIWAVLNVLLCAPVLGLIWVWSLKRQLLEVGVACGIEPLGFLSAAAGGAGERKEKKRKEEREKEREKEKDTL